MPLIKGPTYHARLAAFFFFNALVFVALVFGDGSLPANWAEVTSPWKAALPAGMGMVLVGILNSQLSPETKAKMVFLRWTHALPGHRAFSTLGPADPRVDMARLEAKLGTLPCSPSAQNDTWYRLYRAVRDEPVVLGVHGDFLLFRDGAAAAWCMAVLLSPAAFWLAEHALPAAAYTLALLAQAVLTTRAARDRGERLVATVLALAASD
jgi:hypothetical protein